MWNVEFLACGTIFPLNLNILSLSVVLKMLLKKLTLPVEHYANATFVSIRFDFLLSNIFSIHY